MQVKIMKLKKEEARLTYQEAGGIVIITIRRPQRRNALSLDMWRELKRLAKKALKTTKKSRRDHTAARVKSLRAVQI